jgi:pyrophosphate--fructose-6-phosphate 1-phosphotransferase
MSDDSTLYGFVGGTRGLCNGDVQILDAETIAPYRGLGGYELLGRSSDSISSKDFDKVLETCQKLNLTGLVLIGGARTCTDAAYLSEFLLGHRCETVVVVAPADMGGSLRNQFVESTVGFDTATKVSAQIVGQ